MKTSPRSRSLASESVRSLRSDKRFRRVFLVLFAAVVVAMGYIFHSYLWPCLFAVVFYVALKPVYDFIGRRIKARWLCAAITVSLFVLLIVIPLLFLLLALADQTFQFYQLVARRFDPNEIQRLIYENDSLRYILSKLGIARGDLLHRIMGMVQGLSLDLFSNITDMVSFSIKLIVNFFFMILLLFSIFMEGPKLGVMVYDILPFPNDIEKIIFARLREVIRVIVAGNLAIMFLQGVCISIGFLIFDVDIPLLAGSAAAMLSLIPVVGTLLVWMPAALYFLVTGHIVKAGLFAGWCLFCYLFLENWVKPKFFGEKLNFHPIVFFFLLIGSLGVFNLPGIIVGPILLTLFYSLWGIYHTLYIEPGETEQRALPGKSSARKNKSGGAGRN